MSNKLFKNINEISTSFLSERARVLDLGCNNGYLANVLMNKFNCEVVGVEIDKDLVKKAKRKIQKLISGDIENENVFKKIKAEPKFNVIYASAILEHLINPTKVVKKLKKTLKKNGFFVITLPNIAHWSVRMQLFFGKFNYENSGLLDKTHLHFFTLATARKFIEEECQLKIDYFDFEFTRLPIFHYVSLIPYGRLVENMIYKKFPGLFAYQMVFKAFPQ